MTNALRVRRPGRLALRVRRARIEPARRLDVPHRLRVADLRREVAEQRELLHHAEVVLRWLLRDRRNAAGLRRARCVLLAPVGQELVAGGLPGIGGRNGPGCAGALLVTPLLLLLPRLAAIRVGLLLLVEPLQQGEALLWRGLHEAHAVVLDARLVQLPHAVAEGVLVALVVGVGDHE